MENDYVKIARLADVNALRDRLATLGIDLPVDQSVLSSEQGSPLAEPMRLGPYSVGNRWCIHPMEGWDANSDGSPSEHVLRRWRNFGRSGAKLIWGGEAAAVCRDGRANPNQTLAIPENRRGLERLLQTVKSAHHESFGNTDDLVVGLQLTHSGRFCRPNNKGRAEPRIAYHHPLLDEKFQIDPHDNDVVMGKVDFGGVVTDVCLAYLPDINVGDYTIVHVGFAISKVDEMSAQRTLATFEELGLLEEQLDELRAMPDPDQRRGGIQPE